MRRFLMLVTSIAAIGFAGSQAVAQPGLGAGSASAQKQVSALDQQIEADSAAIAADRNRMGRDQANPELLVKDEHQLHEDVLTRAYHHGAAEDDNGLHDKGW